MTKGKRLSSKEIEEAVERVCKRDGKRCWYCPKESQSRKKKLVLHHVDNRPENNPKDGSNWRLACRSHNHRLNPRGSSRYNQRRSLRIEDLRVARPQTEEMRRNQIAKALFIEHFNTCMDEDGEVNVDDICGYVARQSQIEDTKGIGVTSATPERYCNDMVRGNSPYYLDEESNCIKRHPLSAEPIERTPES